jgi:hypothetical protein
MRFFGNSKLRFGKKYIAFLTIVPLLVVTAMINVECPVCGGTGSVVSLPAMENVEILSMESKEIEITRDACGTYMIYRYDVSFSVFNDGKEDAEGWLKLNLRELIHGNILDTQFVAIIVPGETIYNVTYNVWFGTGLDVSEKTQVEAEVVIGDVPCSVSNGTGKISLNTFLLVNSLKDTYNKIVKEEVQYNPPEDIDWEDYQFDNE